MNAIPREKRTHGTQAFPFQIYPSLEAPESDLVPYHWHPEHEFIMVEHGEVELTLGDTQYCARPGEVYFVNSEQLHEIRGGPAGTFRAFVFPMDSLQFSRTDLAQNDWLAPLAQGKLVFAPIAQTDCPIAPMLVAALHEILNACTMQLPAFHLQVKAALLRIIALVASQNLLLPRHGKADYKSNTLREIVVYLDEHCTERITLPSIAARFHLSPQYFCTFFKDNLGRTLTQHINFLRIERASCLLRDTDLPIMEVGMSVGFDNFSYFIKRFSECYGCTPSAYRKAMLTHS